MRPGVKQFPKIPGQRTNVCSFAAGNPEIHFRQSDGGGPQDSEATIEFVARYRIEKADFEHHEIATFGRVEGEWRFIDGKMVTPPPERREAPKFESCFACCQPSCAHSDESAPVPVPSP